MCEVQGSLVYNRKGMCLKERLLNLYWKNAKVSVMISKENTEMRSKHEKK